MVTIPDWTDGWYTDQMHLDNSVKVYLKQVHVSPLDMVNIFSNCEDFHIEKGFTGNNIFKL